MPLRHQVVRQRLLVGLAHVSITHAREVHIPRMAAALTKCDLVEDQEMLDLVTMEVRELLLKNGYGGERDDTLVGAISALAGEGRGARTTVALPTFFDRVVHWIG